MWLCYVTHSHVTMRCPVLLRVLGSGKDDLKFLYLSRVKTTVPCLISLLRIREIRLSPFFHPFINSYLLSHVILVKKNHTFDNRVIGNSFCSDLLMVWKSKIHESKTCARQGLN
jgi:hypothetical protein